MKRIVLGAAAAGGAAFALHRLARKGRAMHERPLFRLTAMGDARRGPSWGAGAGLTERRRSRTDRAVGCTTAQVEVSER